MSISSLKQMFVSLGLPLLGGFVLAVLALYYLPHKASVDSPQVDMSVYYQAEQAVLSHQGLYNAPVHTYGPDRYPVWYLYAPQFAVALSPLGLLKFRHYVGVWYALLVLSMMGYAYNLATIARPDSPLPLRLRDALSWFFVVFITPTEIYSIRIGNVDILLCFLTSVAFVSRYRGVIFAVASQIKPFTLLPLALSWARERYSPWGALACLVVGCVIGALGCGVESFVLWRESLSGILGQGTFNTSNVSIPFAVLRALHGMGVWHYSHGPLAAGPRLYLTAASIAGPLITAYLCRKLSPLKLYAAVLLSCVVFAPICWANYLTVAYILVALTIREKLPQPSTEPSAVAVS